MGLWPGWLGLSPAGLAWLARPQVWLAGPQAWLSRPQAWLAGPPGWMAQRGGRTNKWTDGNSPHSTGLRPLSLPKKSLCSWNDSRNKIFHQRKRNLNEKRLCQLPLSRLYGGQTDLWTYGTNNMQIDGLTDKPTKRRKETKFVRTKMRLKIDLSDLSHLSVFVFQ